MKTPSTQYKDLVLVGGGHSHALLLKMWAMNPVPGVRLTLISPQVQTPYSGMLPGLIAGHYSFDEAHIDLNRLCGITGTRFIQDQVTEIDLQQKEVSFSDRPPIGFDVLSINSGITPDTSVPGSELHTIPVKPIALFYPRWQQLLARLTNGQNTTSCPYRIAVVGGGAAGVELILAMHHATTNIKTKRPLQFCLIQRGNGLPEHYPARLQRKIRALFNARKIQIHSGYTVSETQKGVMYSATGDAIYADSIFWCAQAKAATWPQRSGLAVDSNGFIAVNAHLQSLSHDFVFAAGDIAQQEGSPTPRAGVYAVRQAPYLLKNLRNHFLGRALSPYRPQAHILSLIACGDQYAVGCRPNTMLPSISGKWVWQWKDSIDRKFMRQFSELTSGDMNENTESSGMLQTDEPPNADSMRCGGCGAKVGATILSRTTKRLQPISREGVMLGLGSADDAAAITVPPEHWLIQSVDVFRALIDDPYLQGQIAALHALSDLFAMNAAPHSAQAIVTLPYAGETLVERDLFQLMSGAVKVLNEHQCALIGGHTSEGAELSIGFCVNGFAQASKILRKSQPQLGDKLILTKQLGTGVLFSAHNQYKAHGKWIESAVSSMLQSNRKAGEIFSLYHANACTDITGFGLAGHLIEMLTPADHTEDSLAPLAATLSLHHIPLLDGALTCSQNGILSSLYTQNQRAETRILNANDWDKHPVWPLLFDPQTSGGLLASVAAHEVDGCLSALRLAGYHHACVVGEITPPHDTASVIELCALESNRS